jgi:hypothetical protein
MDPTKEQRQTETEKGETGESMLIIFFDIKGTDHKEFLLALQTVNSIHYCGLLRRLSKKVRRLRSELWQDALVCKSNEVNKRTQFEGL